MAPPTENAAIHTPMANCRSCSSWNMLRISDIVDGASVAPATPSSARIAISISALRENAAITEATANAAAPISNSLRRPIRSPSVPIVIRKPATRKPYTSTIHSNWLAVGSSSALIAGSARFSTVRSIA